MKYKLLVLDVDGTLLNNENEISKRTLSTLIKAQHTGVRIVLASGRPTSGILPFAKALELDHFGGFILSYNGSKVIKADSGEVLFERRINPEQIPYLEKKARKNDFSIFTYHDDYLLTNNADNIHVRREAWLNHLRIMEEPEFSIAIDFAPCKCVGVLMEQLGVTRDEVIAIGDGVADVTMLQQAGVGVAMGHAQDSVKICADYVTASNEEDGVAQAVEKLILSEVRASEIPLEFLNAQTKHALMGNLGIQYTYASPERVEATMPVDERTRQPFGILHGGATLALAETVAGLGSMVACQPDEIVVGMQVSGNHVSSAHEGDTVRAVGTIVHKGRSSHVWNVDVFTSTNKLVSSVRVVNSILKKR